MKEEISQQRCTIGAHWYTNNPPENRASKTNVDVVDKKVNSETKLSTRDCKTMAKTYILVCSFVVDVKENFDYLNGSK